MFKSFEKKFCFIKEFITKNEKKGFFEFWYIKPKLNPFYIIDILIGY